MSRQIRVLCGTPDYLCSGSRLITDQALSKKCHRSHEEAFNCYAHYLVNELGYTRLNSRDFYKDGEPILVLTKKIRFGGLLVTGKEHSRYMPEIRKAGNRGVIIG